jgi:hypothetical protein
MMCICLCIYSEEGIFMHTCIYAHMCYLDVYIYAHMLTHICVHMCIHIFMNGIYDMYEHAHS